MPAAPPPKLAVLEPHHVPVEPHAPRPRPDLVPGGGDDRRRQEREAAERFLARRGRAEPHAFGLRQGAEGEGERGGRGAR
jgi:hypothetical protein